MRRCPTPEPIITPPSALPHATQPVRSNAILALPSAPFDRGSALETKNPAPAEVSATLDVNLPITAEEE